MRSHVFDTNELFGISHTYIPNMHTNADNPIISFEMQRQNLAQSATASCCFENT